MNGFVKDYISVLRSLKKQGCLTAIFNFLGLNLSRFKLDDKYEDYKAIIECFQPDQIPVMATLAKEFAVFDHWFCDVPSQTYTNRAFWHSGTAFGNVNNSPITKWMEHKNDPTLFNSLEDKGIPWKIYTDNPISLTGIVHFQQLLDYHLTNFKSFNHFLNDVQNGQLPAYSFVEPRFFTPHNDQHPSSYDSFLYGPSTTGSVLLGEKLIRDVYNAIRNSKSEMGNNWKNTLLVITHDEHGGCYDHVSPGTATPPSSPPEPGEQGFLFDRLGVRVPMIMISAYIQPNTIVNNPYQHTSFLHTMCEKWKLACFTDRDASAPKFDEVFTTNVPRPPKEWPVLPEPAIPSGHARTDFSEAPLGDLEKAILASVSQWKSGSTADVEKLNTVKEAMLYLSQFEDLPGAKMEELTYQLKLD
jgi:phospholipase C